MPAGQSIIEQMIDQHSNSETTCETENASIADLKLEGLLIGTIERFNSTGLPMVVVYGTSKCFTANCVCELEQLKVGAQCAVMFPADGVSVPIILGILQQSVIVVDSPGEISVTQNAEKIELHSEVEINLRCGTAHLRMTADGLVELRGDKVVSHSTGLNRIRGASVKLN